MRPDGRQPNQMRPVTITRDFLRHAARGEALSAHVAELRAKARIEIQPA